MELLEDYSLDNISVVMICEKAGVSRQSFYYHYRDIKDVFETLTASEITLELRHCNTYHTWVKGFETILNYLHDRKKRMMHVYRSSYNEAFRKFVHDLGYEIISKAVTQCAFDNHVIIDRGDAKFIVRYYCAVFMDILDDFFEDEMNDDIDEIVRRCSRMMGGSIHDALHRFM